SVELHEHASDLDDSRRGCELALWPAELPSLRAQLQSRLPDGDRRFRGRLHAYLALAHLDLAASAVHLELGIGVDGDLPRLVDADPRALVLNEHVPSGLHLDVV